MEAVAASIPNVGTTPVATVTGDLGMLGEAKVVVGAGELQTVVAGDGLVVNIIAVGTGEV